MLLASVVCPAADLAVQRLALHQYEDGPLNAPGYEYLPGETVWLSARISGYERKVQDVEEETDNARLSWQLRVLDPSGTLVVPPMRGLIEETLRTKEDREWVPKFVVSFLVPSHAGRGEYRIPVTIRDDISKKEAAGEIRFRVKGEETPAKDTALGIRDFRFLANPDDRVPLRPAAYKQGSALIARFQIVGYSYEGNNRFDVDYGLAIQTAPDAEGDSRIMLQQERAATEKGESFYAQRWIPAGFGFKLDSDVPVGEYTVILIVRDKITGKTAEVRDTFRVVP
jgi:hypothetical protein